MLSKPTDIDLKYSFWHISKGTVFILTSTIQSGEINNIVYTQFFHYHTGEDE